MIHIASEDNYDEVTGMHALYRLILQLIITAPAIDAACEAAPRNHHDDAWVLTGVNRRGMPPPIGVVHSTRRSTVLTPASLARPRGRRDPFSATFV
jgi:hypothetical protein